MMTKWLELMQAYEAHARSKSAPAAHFEWISVSLIFESTEEKNKYAMFSISCAQQKLEFVPMGYSESAG